MSFNINLDEIFLIVNFMKMDDMKIDDRMRRVGENEMKGGKIVFALFNNFSEYLKINI